MSIVEQDDYLILNETLLYKLSQILYTFIFNEGVGKLDDCFPITPPAAPLLELSVDENLAIRAQPGVDVLDWTNDVYVSVSPEAKLFVRQIEKLLIDKITSSRWMKDWIDIYRRGVATAQSNSVDDSIVRERPWRILSFWSSPPAPLVNKNPGMTPVSHEGARSPYGTFH